MNFIKDYESFENFKYEYTHIVYFKLDWLLCFDSLFWEEFVKVWTNFQNSIKIFESF